ncbi:hypothetical protein RclHR1_23310001 [Rhizophagus clarus]|uniref:Uncharacterized protein n=1 Tax=Rhizophagus clarus TaxID=94130 RepID=A0A2Z6R921_9GLOM|nr:hypothetical protein RclHR1_23310001 [Rhizophagus clarus]
MSQQPSHSQTRSVIFKLASAHNTSSPANIVVDSRPQQTSLMVIRSPVIDNLQPAILRKDSNKGKTVFFGSLSTSKAPSTISSSSSLTSTSPSVNNKHATVQSNVDMQIDSPSSGTTPSSDNVALSTTKINTHKGTEMEIWEMILTILISPDCISLNQIYTLQILLF